VLTGLVGSKDNTTISFAYNIVCRMTMGTKA